MARLYVFGIGGTGSRVIKSLTMLLGSGVQLNGFDVVPIIIDPDQNNGDVTRTIDLLNNYKLVRSHLSFDSTSVNKFFSTKIGFSEDSSRESFRLKLKDVENEEFRDFIDYQGLEQSDRALVSMLFSEQNLTSDMEVGFKGNPNIGSVVLNQFKESEMYARFSSTFQQGDRIFIISSIFGGTGAAGFPLILKNIKDTDPNVTNHATIKSAPVGAVTVLPYFGVEKDPNSEIDQSTFISKAKAALYYYQHNVNNQVDTMYYIGDNIKSQYSNEEGAFSQKNDAHFVELAAAMAIVDFANQNETQLSNRTSKEFGIKSEEDEITIKDLGDSTKHILAGSLTQFTLFHRFLNDYFPENLQHAAWRDGTPVDSSFLTCDFYSNYLRPYRTYFEEWLKELARNRRGFSPFNLEIDSNHIFDIVKGYIPQTQFDLKGKNYTRIQHYINHAQHKMSNSSAENKFISVMYQATKEVVREKYNFN
jgi:hypothetical protein